MSKNIILSPCGFILFMMLFPSFLFAQEGFHLGTVKGENVTYQVKRTRMHHVWSVLNVHNPDTTLRPYKGKTMALNRDVRYQILVILNKYLTDEELQKLAETDDCIMVYMRTGTDKRKLQQVTRFMFLRSRANEKNTLNYDGFWLNLPPDRLHELEKRIVEELTVPKEYEIYGTEDFFELVMNSEIADPEKARDIQKDNRKNVQEINVSIQHKMNKTVPVANKEKQEIAKILEGRIYHVSLFRPLSADNSAARFGDLFVISDTLLVNVEFTYGDACPATKNVYRIEEYKQSPMENGSTEITFSAIKQDGEKIPVRITIKGLEDVSVLLGSIPYHGNLMSYRVLYNPTTSQTL